MRSHIKLILLVAALEVFGVLVGVVVFLLDRHDCWFWLVLGCGERLFVVVVGGSDVVDGRVESGYEG